MSNSEPTSRKAVLLTALTAGALWGIFESTVGYLLHLLPVSIGFLVWYPVACFFLIKSYRESGSYAAVLLTASLASAVKLLNLLLPGRVDKVLNPAVSILFEGLAVFAVLYMSGRLKSAPGERRWVSAALSLGANSTWRLLFIGYLAVLVPQWMRDVSVLRSTKTLFRFLVVDNLAGSAVAWLGFQAWKHFRDRRAQTDPKAPRALEPRLSSAALLLLADIGLQFLLR